MELTGKLDSIYSLVCGPNNGWLGGMGDGWERGPYWIDGLVPLAYMLDDQKLKTKGQHGSNGVLVINVPMVTPVLDPWRKDMKRSQVRSKVIARIGGRKW